MAKYTNKIQVHVDDDTYQELQRQAAAKGLMLSTYTRLLVLEGIVKELKKELKSE